MLCSWGSVPISSGLHPRYTCKIVKRAREAGDRKMTTLVEYVSVAHFVGSLNSNALFLGFRPDFIGTPPQATFWRALHARRISTSKLSQCWIVSLQIGNRQLAIGNV